MKTKRFCLGGAIGVTALCVGLGLAPADAAVTAESEVTFDWTTFNIQLDPGMDLQWGQRFSHSDANAYFDGIERDWQGGFIDGWSGEFEDDSYAEAHYATAHGFANASASTTADEVRVWSKAHSDGGGRFDARAHGWGENRYGIFEVIGEGMVTFSIDYSMSVTLIETGARPRPDEWAGAFVSADIYVNYSETPLEGEAGDPWWQYEDRWFPEWAEPLDEPWTKSGTLSVSLWFEHGQGGYFRVGSTANADAYSIPEPSTLTLLGLGGLLLIRRRQPCQASPISP